MTDTRPPASKNIVTTDWLAARLGKPDIAIVEARSTCRRQPQRQGGVSRRSYSRRGVLRHRRGRRSFLRAAPHAAGPTQFSKAAGALGIGKNDTIVVYDGVGLGGAPRVWWTFRIFGASNVYILDGGLPKWKAEGRPIEQGAAKRLRSKFDAELDTGDVANADDMSDGADQQFRPGGGRKARGPLPRRSGPSRGPACAAATCRVR